MNVLDELARLLAVFSGNRLMAKAEIRSPKSERNPKAEARSRGLVLE
jgi:hypothetical protein